MGGPYPNEKKSIVDEILGDLSKSSAAKQVVLGTASGWLTGFVTMKVGKIAAVAVGGGILILQIAQHKGYIKINWDKVHKQADKVMDRIEKEATGRGPDFMDKIVKFARHNEILAASFGGGFLLGLVVS